MAEAIARHHLGPEAEVFSAGHFPTGRVADHAVAALRTLGYDADGLASKGFDAVPLDAMDVIVSLMGPQGLVGLPRQIVADTLAWSIRDPYGEEMASYLATAAALERHIERLARDLGRTELSAL
jgi:protein-tyrosine-phosphatase